MKLTEKGQKTKSHILTAALELFSKQGYNGTTTKEIALYAGVAEGTIFRYFSNKRSLLHSILQPLLLDTITDTVSATANMPFKEALEYIVYQRLALIDNNWPLFKFVFSEAAFQPLLRQYLHESLMLPMQKTMVAFMEKHITQGTIRPLNPYLTVQAFVGMVASFIFYRYALRPIPGSFQADDEESLQVILDIFWQGVKNDD